MGLVWDTNVAAISLFWDTNMAVKSCESTYSVCEWYMWSPFRERSRNGLRIRILPIRLFPTRHLSFFKKNVPSCEDNTEIILKSLLNGETNGLYEDAKVSYHKLSCLLN